jgi:hypothetical protein
VSFTVGLTGNPAPTVQWQVSTNGTTWRSIAGATSPTLTFVATRKLNGNQYRALLTNSLGTTATDPATLSVRAGRGVPLPITGQDLTFGGIALVLLIAGAAVTVLARRRNRSA